MHTRTLGPFTVSALSFGCMSLSHAYGTPPSPALGAPLLHQALDLGYTHLDSAALYGFGANETLIGQTLKHRRAEFVLGSKGGIVQDEGGRREITSRPAVIRRNCDESLARLQTDVIDLYYLHRWDKRVPIEDTVGEMARLVAEGKVRAIGLSEVSATTLRRAHAVHPIAALQTEYSLWTRNPEIATLEACRELGVAFVAFSPLGRGFLTGALLEPSRLPPKDFRHSMPRFHDEHFPSNLRLLDRLGDLARGAGCSMGQLALAWLLARADHIIPIPGTANAAHLAENAAAERVRLDATTMAALDEAFPPEAISGNRYSGASQAEVDTEQYPDLG